MKKQLLLIFTKNPVLGEVKTRLASTIGDEKALMIFHNLIGKTADTVEPLSAHKTLYYSNKLEFNDLWKNRVSDKKVQKGNNLGERMGNAFKNGFENGFSQIVVIGTDLWDLEAKNIEQAFEALESKSAVIGPATDGGYYLLGLSEWIPEVFENKEWGTSTVFEETVQNLKNKKIALLESKNDIDYYEDLRTFPELLKLIDR